MSDKQVRGQYTQEFKLEAVRLVKTGQSVGMTAKVLGIPKASLSNWVRASERGQLGGAGERPVTPEQMELAPLRAELAKTKMELDIIKKAAAYFAKYSMRSTLSSTDTAASGLYRFCVNSWRSAPVATTSIASGVRSIR